MEETQEQIPDQKHEFHFMPCLNENCNTFHIVTIDELRKIEDINFIDALLCDDCKSRKENFHILQCMSCRTIIEFLPILPGETAGVVYIEKCLRCGGTIEDELSFVSALYKHIHI
ncbi:MAG: hypothetical protein N3F03_02445 [Ignavibacteria bacterium]|nr:hypothetical protein [Ignavibacteria bacterium]